MKAVILEIRGKYAAALADDGSVIKIPDREYEIGQVVELQVPALQTKKHIARIACAAAVIALVTISALSYYTPVSYVSLDANPSIEFTLNRYDRVIGCRAVNGDGEEIVEQLRLDSKDIREAVRLTVLKFAEEGFLTEDHPVDLLVATSNRNAEKSEELAKTLEETATEAAKEAHVQMVIEAESVDQDQVEQAKDMGITAGKLNLVQKLQQSAGNGEEIDVEEWSGKSIREIIGQIQENKQEEKETASQAKGQEKKTQETESKQETDQETGQEADQENGQENDQETGQAESAAADSADQSQKNNGNSKSEKSDEKNSKNQNKANGSSGGAKGNNSSNSKNK